ncbi:MAG TPA: DMT family protein [Aestuariivirga sp.]|nr:DMT family protein [Alphaproteobacteria bacterium]HRX35983.1 DMT family protein [Aestuariivirga sp.]
MPAGTTSYVAPILLLVASNVFMTFAWYGHLNYTNKPLWMAVFVSWGIALFEYWLAVPANRIGYGVYSAAQLKTIQEVITFAVFSVFSVWYLKQAITVNHLIGFSLIIAGAFFVFRS